MPKSNGSFKVGNPGGPGRPKGSRHRISEAFLRDLCADWEAHGAAALVAVREQDPSTYVRVAASLLPKEVKITQPVDDLSDAELDAAIDHFRALAAASVAALGEGEGAEDRAEQAGAVPPVH